MREQWYPIDGQSLVRDAFSFAALCWKRGLTVGARLHASTGQRTPVYTDSEAALVSPEASFKAPAMPESGAAGARQTIMQDAQGRLSHDRRSISFAALLAAPAGAGTVATAAMSMPG